MLVLLGLRALSSDLQRGACAHFRAACKRDRWSLLLREARLESAGVRAKVASPLWSEKEGMKSESKCLYTELEY
jgi:hypothetical protein